MKKRGLIYLVIFLLLCMGQAVSASDDVKEERKWQDETVYFLMIDRFNNGDSKNDMDVDIKSPTAFHGGDFQGIISELDYIHEMGFTAIALTPIFNNGENGYHGNDVIDFNTTEEHYGSIDVFKKLVDEVHKRDMKIMIDFDISHVGENHPWSTDASKADWLSVDGTKEGLREVNLENPEVKQYMIEMAKWWVEETDIDGYRLHSLGGAAPDFWIDFSSEIKKTKKDFYLLGDIEWKPSDEFLQYSEAGIDAFTNYSLNAELKKAFEVTNQPFNQLFSEINQVPNPYDMATFMDNEDIIRFTSDMVEKNVHPGPRWKQALTFLYTTPGIPFIYYGSEIALNGGEGPENHLQMNFRTDPELIDYMTNIGDLRSQLPSLTRGKMEVLFEENGLAIYKRIYEDEITVIAINNSTVTKTIAIKAGQLEDNKELRGLLNNGLVRSSDGQYILTIDRDMSEIYLLSEKTGINISYIIAMVAVLMAFAIFLILIVRKSKKIQPK